MKPLIVGVLTILTLTGCQSAPRVESQASGRLLRDATRFVMMVDNARAKGCKEKPVITTAPVQGEPGEVAERWTVTRCDTVRTYMVRYQPAREGGTQVRVSGPE